MRGKVKNITKILIIVLSVLLSIPVLGVIIFNLPGPQSFIVKKITNEISKNINTTVSIDAVKIQLFNRITLKNLYIEDLNNDTLLFSKSVHINVRKIDRDKKSIKLNKILFDQALIRFNTDTSDTINIQFLIDIFQNGNADKKDDDKWAINCKKINVTESVFLMQKYNYDPNTTGVDFSNLRLNDFNLKTNLLTIENDTTSLLINELSFNEPCGFSVKKMSGFLSVHKKFLHLSNVSLHTGKSKIIAKKLNFDFTEFKDLTPVKFGKKVKLNLDLLPSIISMNDLSYFSPELNKFTQRFTFSGKITGKYSDLKIKDIQINYLYKTKIVGNLDLIGLPNFKETFIYLNLKDLTTNVDELVKINNSLPESKKIKLSKKFFELKNIHYKGNFTGFTKDFVAYGNLYSNLGYIATDISIQPDTANYMRFKGKVTTNNFQLGTLIGNDSIVGNISMNASVNGARSGDNIHGLFDGTINSIDFNNYNYKNVILKGKMSNNTFDGSININDPNIQLEFLGNFDFSNEIPEFHFNTKVPYANLQELHFLEKDSIYKVSANLFANFKGVRPDDINGEITISDIEFNKPNAKFEISKFSIFADSLNNIKTLKVQSDFLDGQLEGNYKFATLISSANNLIYNFIPALHESGKQLEKKYLNNFKYWVEFKETDHITNFFLPKFRVYKGTKSSGIYNSKENIFKTTLYSKQITFKNNYWKDVDINLMTNDSSMTISTNSNKLEFYNHKSLENFITNTEIKNNCITYSINWDNHKSNLIKGDFMASTTFTRPEGYNHPIIDFKIIPSEIIYLDSLWKFNKSNIIIDSSFIWFDNFRLKSTNQSLRIDGAISENKTDTLFTKFNNFNLSIINELLRNKSMSFDGLLNGAISVSDVYNNFIFNTNLEINDLAINNEKLGYTSIQSVWDNKKDKLHLLAFNKRGKLKSIEIEGDYSPKSKEIDFNLDLDKLQTRIFNPYTISIFSDIKGFLSGNVKIKGDINKPISNGKLTFQKTSLTVDYLNTRYSFASDIDIKDNNVLFDEIKLTDANGQNAYLSGNISNDYFKNFRMNIQINAENFSMLNTSSKDNELFYGKSYCTGIIEIKGPAQSLQMNLSIKTEENTELFVPLETGSEVSDNSFIQWETNNEAEESEDPEKPQTYEVDVDGLKLNIEFEVTPEAEIQLIFDSKMGDIIKARGHGNIKMDIDTKGKFQMYGNYNIEKGDYLFTLQNVINKRFTIMDGSKISWNGDPLEADIDLLAVYKTKANLSVIDHSNTDGTSSRVLVECHMMMTDKLMSPEINLGLYLPNSDEDTREILENAITTEDALKNQFLALLIINNFFPDPNLAGGIETSTSGQPGAGDAAGITASEFFTNQLSNLLSQLSTDFDIGINYHPGDEITSSEVEIAMSTEFFNNRVSVNGNVDVGGNETNAPTSQTSNIVGDFDVEVKLNKKGNIRLKAYNRSNENLLFEEAPYTQGVGIFYKKEFDNWFNKRVD